MLELELAVAHLEYKTKSEGGSSRAYCFDRSPQRASGEVVCNCFVDTCPWRRRAILRADTNEHVLPGEILMAPFTDPGWAICFFSVEAAVVDQGGVLSHGSILAPKSGIPAVVNVGPATKITKTGRIVLVDGTHGRVRPLP